jgi:hypothetical protein
MPTVLPTETLEPTQAIAALPPTVQPTLASGEAAILLPIVIKGIKEPITQSYVAPTAALPPEATHTPAAVAMEIATTEEGQTTVQTLAENNSEIPADKQPDIKSFRLPTQYFGFAVIALLLTSILILFSVRQRQK